MSKYRNFKLLFSLLLVGSLSPAWLALAQELPPQPLTEQQAEAKQNSQPRDEVAVIGMRIEQPAAELPASISVLQNDEVELTNATHAQEFLRRAPGVSYQRGNGQESLPSIRSAVLTGAGACGNVLVMEEAIPVRAAGACNVNELFDTHFEQASRIELVRGAGTAFYGSNALLGAINVHLDVDAENLLALELGPNSFWRARASYGYQRGENGAGRLFLTWSDDGGYRDESGYQQQKLAWRHREEFAAWSVNAGLSYANLDQETAGFITGLNAYQDPQLQRRNLDPEAFRKSETLRAWARFERASERGQFALTPYIRYTDMAFLQHFLPGDPLEENQQQGVGLQTSYRYLARPELSVSAGLDLELANSELLQTQDQPTPGSAFLQETIPVGKHYDYAVDAIQAALFTQVDWRFRPQWRMLAGARLETMRYDYDNRMLSGRSREDGSECGFGGCRYSRPADRQDRFTHFSPRLELQFQPSAQWRWHVSVADSFRAPQTTELYRLQRQQNVAELQEVSAVQVEAGLRHYYGESRIELSVYSTEQKNVIIRDSNFFNIDGQKISSRGLELDWLQMLGERWSLRLVGSVAEHEYASDPDGTQPQIDGNLVDTAPRFVGSAFLAWQPSDVLSLELEVHDVSRYYLEPQNRSSYPGHTIAHLRGKYLFSESLSLSMRLMNLTDEAYAERADFTEFTQERYFPGEPRSVFGELRWNF